jgi:hypothetical protein
MKYTNCIIFSIKLFTRRSRKSKVGYLVIRKSHWGLFPHVTYGRLRKDGTLAIVGYTAINKRWWTTILPLYKGRVSWGERSKDEM